jgi:RNA polymerase sigma-70 factor (ECF subfamily)
MSKPTSLRSQVHVSSTGDGAKADDGQLVARCLQGDTTAFETLVERYHRVLYTVAYRMLGNAEDARDATQEAFVKAYERLASFNPELRFFSWIYRIVTNECLNEIRARRVQVPVPPDLEAAGGPALEFETGERRRRVQAALLTLTPEHREVVVLRHFAGLSYGEMALALGIPAKTVKSRLYSARQALGQRLLGWDPRD